jgi:hypothetical protein
VRLLGAGFLKLLPDLIMMSNLGRRVAICQQVMNEHELNLSLELELELEKREREQNKRRKERLVDQE